MLGKHSLRRGWDSEGIHKLAPEALPRPLRTSRFGEHAVPRFVHEAWAWAFATTALKLLERQVGDCVSI